MGDRPGRNTARGKGETAAFHPLSRVKGPGFPLVSLFVPLGPTKRISLQYASYTPSGCFPVGSSRIWDRAGYGIEQDMDQQRRHSAVKHQKVIFCTEDPRGAPRRGNKLIRRAAMVKILVLVSGNGSNLQALIDAEKSGVLGRGKIALVVSDRPSVYALERAAQGGIPALVEEAALGLSEEEKRRDLSDRILGLAQKYEIDLIILAGFLSVLAGDFINVYSGRIINLHPSLLPKFGGPGMYGEKVHQAVLAAGDRESGCTVHLVDAGTDTGPILLQRKIPVLPWESPASLAERIHREEHTAIVEAAAAMVKRAIPGVCETNSRAKL